MAGDRIYSLDRDRFQKFVHDPSEKQLLAFAKCLADQLGGDDDELEEDDPIRAWPREPEQLRGLVKAGLARPDWYGDLSDAGKEAWSAAVSAFCEKKGPDG